MAESSRGKSICAAPSTPTIPLLRRFPALAALPRVSLGRFPTPVEPFPLRGSGAGGTALWVKRDDLAGVELGGNKLRALEFLLGDVRPGDVVLTAGGIGSTHVLATAHHARAMGARVHAVRWAHDMNPIAAEVAAHAARLCERVWDVGGPVRGVLMALLMRARSRARWVPMGGSAPQGILGHVNAAFELAEQLERGELPAPSRVVVPLGTGGTAAGLALGFRIVGLDATVVGARVVPRIAGSRWRVLGLARATARLIERVSRERVPRVDASHVRVVHDVYGGAYGRTLERTEERAALVTEVLGVRLDATYSAKAFAAALALAHEGRATEGPTLFWLTFDGRWMRPLATGGRA